MGYKIRYKMPLVRQIVGQREGSVEVSSTPSKWTTVSMLFPPPAGP